MEVRIDPQEVYRYLGCAGTPDEGTVALVESLAHKMLETVRPRSAWRLFDLTAEEGGVRLADGLLLPGADLKRHLAGCDRGVLMAATLSAQADGLIRRYERLDMAQALVLDCCASAAIESVCDLVEGEIRGQFPGCSFPFRFSPGYGDLPIDLQNDLLNLLDAPRKIGLCATDSHILTPRKSVTAILGISTQVIAPIKKSCDTCNLAGDCRFRKNGVRCWGEDKNNNPVER